jgi:Flp pilus assembly pilin Flp
MEILVTIRAVVPFLLILALLFLVAKSKNKIRGFCGRFMSDNRGQDLAEYALLMFLAIFLALTISPQLIAPVADVFTKVKTVLGGSSTESAVVDPNWVFVIRYVCGFLACSLLCTIIWCRRRNLDTK